MRCVWAVVRVVRTVRVVQVYIYNRQVKLRARGDCGCGAQLSCW